MPDQAEEEKRAYDPIDDRVFYDLNHGHTTINIERQRVLDEKDKKPITLLELYKMKPSEVIEMIYCSFYPNTKMPVSPWCQCSPCMNRKFK